MKNRQVILLLSNISSDTVIETFNDISRATQHFADTILVYHQKNKSIPESIKILNNYIFTDDIFDELPYIPLKQRSIIPGCDHFPLLKFYLDNPDYDYYWSLEDDVRFRGNWAELFETFRYDNSDLISAFINEFNNEPNWPWWNTFGNINGKTIQIGQRLKAFNPIRRVSRRGMLCLHNYLSDGWYGHLEVLMPTLFKHEGFKITDFGGNGPFVPKGFENKFYDESCHSYIPVKFGDRLNYIYHPIKSIKRPEDYSFKKNCIISAVGKGSLHKGWINQSVDFDLHLLIYDDSYSYYYNDSPFILGQKGYKFNLIYEYLQKNPDYIDKYDYFLFPDDDIEIDSENISKLFLLMHEYNLQIAQPALSNSYYSYEHTLRNRFCKLRFTNFVEMMTPCFSREALQKVLFTFNENTSGWGIDFHWSKLIDFTGKEMAILDEIYCVHTRPIQSYNERNVTELREYLQKYKLNQEIIDFGSIESVQTTPKYVPIISYSDLQQKIIEKLELISESLLLSINENSSIGLSEGRIGISFFFINYYRLTGKRKYYDIALSIFESSYYLLDKLQSDISLSNGMTGVSWFVEYLAQNNLINNETDEVLEDICKAIDVNNPLDNLNSEISIDDDYILKILQLGMHYLVRVRNLAHTPSHNGQHLSEKYYLFQIIDFMEKIKKEYINEDYSLIGLNANQLTRKKSQTHYNIIKFLTLLQQYNISHTKIPLLLNEYLNNICLVSINANSANPISIEYINLLLSANALTKPDFNKITSFEDLMNKNSIIKTIHNNIRSFQLSGECLFKTKTIKLLEQFVDKMDFEEFTQSQKFGLENGLAEIGLTMIASIADFESDWDELYYFIHN